MDELFDEIWGAIGFALLTFAVCFALIGAMHGNVVAIGLGIGIVGGALKSM